MEADGSVKGMLLLVFIHGFKGSSETTFEDFPSRLSHLLRETYPSLVVEPLVYPTYDTRGSLSSAVENFTDWLTSQCLTLESKPLMEQGTGNVLQDSGRGLGMGSVKVVLVGHSMGGLVAVDATLGIARNGFGTGTAPSPPSPPSTSSNHTAAPRANPLWPRVCGVIAYDTPYFGVHPNVFKNSLNKWTGYVQTAQSLGTMFAPLGVGLAAKWGSQKKEEAEAGKMRNGAKVGDDTVNPDRDSTNSAWGKWSKLVSDLGSTSGTNPAAGVSSSSTTPSSSSSTTARTATATRPTADSKATKSSSNWGNALLATGAIALAGGAATAYMNRDKIDGAYGWVSDHMLFVSNLWDDKAMKRRLDDIVQLQQVLFHCYYTRLPAKPARGENERTFVILPERRAKSAQFFTPMDNTRASDEVDAHISMFNPKGNPLYFDLGLRSAALIGLCLENEQEFGDQSRSQAQTSQPPEEEKGLRMGDEGLKREKEQEDEILKRQGEVES
ncbi:hypothetical protein IE53DRAFT_369752 [Violaceomyces palustris]|uniref:Uncharacterized protein n=1 Tax=Violaceomyces palustris TaxID=1673888 RepID=A0ACD0NUP3_9BASI|nr:hypothetical protein IE53DRAFT_369752 [Violaceomyces palustris]